MLHHNLAVLAANTPPKPSVLMTNVAFSDVSF